MTELNEILAKEDFDNDVYTCEYCGRDMNGYDGEFCPYCCSHGYAAGSEECDWCGYGRECYGLYHERGLA